MNKRMNRNRLNIGAYHLQPYSRTEEHIKDVRDCGVDFIVCMDYDKAAFDLFEKYGVGVVVNRVVPGWWGGDGNNAGTMEKRNPLSAYEEAAESFADHPAIWGIDIGDEPSARDFPHYGKVFGKVERLFENQFPYLNLYPNYASVSQNSGEETVNQLGTPSYNDYIREYCENVPADYICYDFYLYSINVNKAYSNLKTVSDACRKYNRDMWIVLQVNSNRPEAWITENQLRFQAFTALAFGAKNIIWACYNEGWWYNHVLDNEGNKTIQYERLKKVNGELKKIADNLTDYDCASTYFVNFDGTDWLNGTEIAPVKAVTTGIIRNLTAAGPVVVGKMLPKAKSEPELLFIAEASDPMDTGAENNVISFSAISGREQIEIITNLGSVAYSEPEDGSFSFTLPASGCAVIKITNRSAETYPEENEKNTTVTRLLYGAPGLQKDKAITPMRFVYGSPEMLRKNRDHSAAAKEVGDGPISETAQESDASPEASSESGDKDK